MKYKKTIAIIITLIMIAMMLTGCGKSSAVKAAEEAINAIGEITMESGDAIANAEKLFNILTDSEKADVSNRLTLVDAREAFEKLQGEKVYVNAKEAYEKLNAVADLCISGMDDVYGAWYFGIYKARDSKESSVFNDMAKETPNLTSTELKDAAELYGNAAGVKGASAIASLMVSKYVDSNWQYCLNVAELAISSKGVYDTITADMEEAQKVLQELTTKYDDYTYYPKLKDYYSAVSSYVEFFQSPTGSFKQLADTINEYENGIRTYQKDVGFLFNK